jgi:hypothetical protein
MVETGASCAGDYRMRPLHLGAREMEEVEEGVKHDFKQALDELFDANGRHKYCHPTFMFEAYASNAETIRAALLIADRLMQEPSEGMIREGGEQDMLCEYPADIFKAMRDQMLREVGA